MSFSNDARNAFVKLKRPAAELIPCPLYGALWLIGMPCGHTIFSSHNHDWLECSVCRIFDLPVASMQVRRAHT